MHELPFAKSIFHAVVTKAEANGATKVTRVVIEVGVLRDFVPEIVQKYWKYVTKGSMAEDSSIEMNEIPATVTCGDCQTVYEINVHDLVHTHCPQCGCQTGKMLTGRELRIVRIEIE